MCVFFLVVVVVVVVVVAVAICPLSQGHVSLTFQKRLESWEGTTPNISRENQWLVQMYFLLR